jgi:hypothetical protein
MQVSDVLKLAKIRRKPRKTFADCPRPQGISEVQEWGSKGVCGGLADTGRKCPTNGRIGVADTPIRTLRADPEMSLGQVGFRRYGGHFATSISGRENVTHHECLAPRSKRGGAILLRFRRHGSECFPAPGL